MSVTLKSSHKRRVRSPEISGSAIGAAADNRIPGNGIHSLLVIPDVGTRRRLNEALAGRGHNVKAFSAGETALKAFQERPSQLVVIGRQLADLDATEFIRRIREYPAGRRSLIMVVVLPEQQADLDALRRAGVDDVISLPLESGLLELRLALAERLVLTERGSWPPTASRDSDVHGEEKSRQPVKDALTDLSRLIRVERALTESEKRYRIVVESSPGFIFLINREGNILDLDMPREEDDAPEVLVTSHIYDYVHEGDRERFRQEIEACLDSFKLRKFEIRNFDKSLTYQVLLALLKKREESSEAVVCTMYNITDRRLAEEALDAERELLATTLRGIGDAVIATDLEGRVILVNRAGEKLTGLSGNDTLHRPINELIDVREETSKGRLELLPARDEILDQERQPENRSMLLVRKGEYIPVSARVAPLLDKTGSLAGSVITLQDISEKRRWEEETHRTQKLEALSVLAGGLAHDFNNLLMQIMLNVSTARMKLQGAPSTQKILSSAERAVKRAKGITQQLLTFSRGGQPMVSRQLLNPLIKESVKFVISGSPVTPEFRLQKDLWGVDIDANQINQVVNNLVINAIHAMPQGGKLFVSTSNVTVDKDHPKGPLGAGDYVEVVMRDRGSGIPPGVLEKIFDPYFTTKSSGNGLGLYSSYNVLARHGGWITVKSKENRGSAFSFYLPGTAAPAPVVIAKHDAVKGHGHILIMDDDEEIRRALSRLLTMQGYKVDTVPDGEAAQRLYLDRRREGKPFDLLILDLTIAGGLGGVETLRKIKKLDPGVKAIAASGYSNDPIMANYEEHGFLGVIPKPFTWDEMSWVLAKAIHRSA